MRCRVSLATQPRLPGGEKLSHTVYDRRITSPGYRKELSLFCMKTHPCHPPIYSDVAVIFPAGRGRTGVSFAATHISGDALCGLANVASFFRASMLHNEVNDAAIKKSTCKYILTCDKRRSVIIISGSYRAFVLFLTIYLRCLSAKESDKRACITIRETHASYFTLTNRVSC